jgi:hypothetical protein
MRRIPVLLLFIIIPFLFSACVKVINPSITIEDARRMVEEAKAEKADIYAPDHMEICQKELSRAIQAMEDGNDSRSRGWAKRAAVDAELAALLARGKRLSEETENFKASKGCQ